MDFSYPNFRAREPVLQMQYLPALEDLLLVRLQSMLAYTGVILLYIQY